jgi:hypothetical protein
MLQGIVECRADAFGTAARREHLRNGDHFLGAVLKTLQQSICSSLLFLPLINQQAARGLFV